MSYQYVSVDQVTFFEREGYLYLRAEEHGLVNLADIREWTDQVQHWPRERGKWMIYDEINTKGERQIMRTEKIIDYHPQLRELLCGDSTFALLKELTGKDMLLFKDKINYKLPGANGFIAHIDAPAYSHMGEMQHIEVMIAVDAQTSQNGCLELVPGSHQTPVPLKIGGCIDSTWEANHEFLQMPLDPGDILIFGSRLPHRSGPNPTGERRAAFFATYHFEVDRTDLRDEYYTHRRLHFPSDHERTDGEDYDKGFKIFAFSSPFAKTEVPVKGS